MQASNNEDGSRENPETSKHSKGKRPIQRRKVCRRLLRQKINAKLKALQELIPNCSKRGQASILDDAINYINNLQFQLQMMMSMRAFWSTFRPPAAMMPPPVQAGMQIPSLAPFFQGTDEMKYEIGTGTSADAYNFPAGLPYSSLLPPQPLFYNQQSSPTRGASTARVLPTQIVPSQPL